MALDMYLDSRYMQLIIQVNNLKKEVAKKIVEKEWLSNYVIPEIKYSYILKLGVNESELFLAELNIDKLRRKISIYDEQLKHNNEILENEIDKLIDKEFKNKNNEYILLKKEIESAIEYTQKDKQSNEYIDKLNLLYTDLIIRLCPLININNSILENQLYDILKNSYKDCNLNIMVRLKALCEQNHINQGLEIGDYEYMVKLKNVYENVLEENKSTILKIRTSETFSNKTILKSEILLRRRKDDINEKIKEIEVEYSKLLKKLDKIKRKNK